jgi:hypothetical protein
MGQLRDRTKQDLKFAGYRPKARLIYLHAIRDFAAYHRRSSAELGAVGGPSDPARRAEPTAHLLGINYYISTSNPRAHEFIEFLIIELGSAQALPSRRIEEYSQRNTWERSFEAGY